MKRVILAAACGALWLAAPALAFNPVKGPPTRAYYAGGSGSAMKARLVVQLPFTRGGLHQPAFEDDVTVLDCHGSGQYVTGGGAGAQNEMGYPVGQFSTSGRGAVINRRAVFLHRHVHFTASGTIDGKTGSITFTVAGCPTRHYALKAGK